MYSYECMTLIIIVSNMLDLFSTVPSMIVVAFNYYLYFILLETNKVTRDLIFPKCLFWHSSNIIMKAIKIIVSHLSYLVELTILNVSEFKGLKDSTQIWTKKIIIY